MLDILKLTRSKTRQKILTLFVDNPGKKLYLREIARRVGVSAANARRELVSLTNSGLFLVERTGKLTFYSLNEKSPILGLIGGQPVQTDIVSDVFAWASYTMHFGLPEDVYCPTRDVFQARLEARLGTWERQIGQDAYLLTAVAGEIGNNSYDHNLGNWPDVAGTFFASDDNGRLVVVADRGRGILATIRFVKPEVKDHREALRVAFTEMLSGRAGERRGNGLKFVKSIIFEKNWHLQFYSGDSVVEIKPQKKFLIKKYDNFISGCLAVIRY